MIEIRQSSRNCSSSFTDSPGSLPFRAASHLLDQRVGEFGGLKPGPGQLQRRAKLPHEMAHAEVAAGHVEGKKGAHQSPAQPRPVSDCRIELLRGGHIVVDQMQRLPPQRLLQAVGKKALDLVAHLQGVHAEIGVERDGLIDALVSGPCAAQHFDQRQQVDRVEGVADHDPSRVTAVGLQIGRQQAGRAGRNDDVSIRPSVHLRV